MFTTSVWLWVGVAITVFWALGAYNRLVGLRAQVLRALQALLGQWQAHAQALRVTVIDSTQTLEADSAWHNLADDSANWQPLAVAAKQCQACLAVVLAKPLAMPSRDDITSVGAAHEVLLAAWQRLTSQQDDLAGSVVPQNLAVQWQHQQMQANDSLRQYQQAALLYNAAIAQFPAVLVAWVFSFQAAQAL